MTIADDKPLSLVHVLSNRIGRAFHGEIETKFGITIAEWRVMLTLASEKGGGSVYITSLLHGPPTSAPSLLQSTMCFPANASVLAAIHRFRKELKSSVVLGC